MADMQYRENTQSATEKIVMILPVFPEGNIPNLLKDIEVSDEAGGYFVPLERAASIRVALTAIKNYTDKNFDTCRVPSREGYPVGGINFWRTA